MKMNFKQIKVESYKSIPVLYGYIMQYRRYIDNENPERVGVDISEFKAKHFFPYGPNKPISRMINYSIVSEFNFNESEKDI